MGSAIAAEALGMSEVGDGGRVVSILVMLVAGITGETNGVGDRKVDGCASENGQLISKARTNTEKAKRSLFMILPNY